MKTIEFIKSFFQFIVQNYPKILEQIMVHMGITLLSLVLSVVVAIPLGILLRKKRSWAHWIIGFAAILQTIPSIALLGLTIPLLGIGLKPAIFVLFIYALLPILRNTYTGLIQLDPALIESALGMGMKSNQVLWCIELPLALPIIMAGIRTATVINIGVATLASYIGAGGLGEFIFGGISLNNPVMILAGAFPVALLAILSDYLLSKICNFRLSRTKFYSLLILIMGLGLSYSLFAKVRQTKILGGLTPEFFGRKDGYGELEKFYALKLHYVILSDALMYDALRNKNLDLISGYSTDGRIKAFHLYALIDNKKVFPPYFAAPILRTETLAKYPPISGILNLLAGKTNDSIMTDLNYQVDYLKEEPRFVAEKFLKKIGLYRNPLMQTGEKFIIGSKIFTEQYILSEMYAILLRGYTHLKVISKTGLGGTQICFGALKSKEIDMYPEYTGTGLLVILKPNLHELSQLGNNAFKIYQYVQDQFQRQWSMQWLKPLGFNNAYCLLIRKEDSEKDQLKTISNLANYLIP